MRVYRYRRIVFVVLMTALIGANTIITGMLTIHAQSEPTAIIDAAFALLSQKVGKSVVRGGDSTYNWTQSVYADTSLGCPVQGQTYTAGKFAGYQITITYQGTTYDFRSPINGQGLFLCSPGGGAPGGVSGDTGSSGSVTPNPGLVVGGKAQINGQGGATLFQNPVNVGPEGIGDGAAGALEAIPGGQVVDIVGGPQQFSNTVWWQVRAADGQVGWILQQFPGRPAGSSDVLVPSASGGNTGSVTITPNPGLAVGGKAQINDQGGATLFQNPVNVGPEGIGDGAPGALGAIPGGQVVDIVGGPQQFSNTVWWQVRTADGKVGWILQQYPGRPAGTPDVLVPSAGGSTQPTAAQSGSNQSSAVMFNTPFTFIDPNGNVAVRSADQPTVAQITRDSSAQVTPSLPFYQTTKHYASLRWSSAGNFLAYEDQSSGTGFIYMEGGLLLPFPVGVASFPLAWSPDGTQVASIDVDPAASGQLVVKAVQLSGAQLESGKPLNPPTQVGKFNYSGNCEGSSGAIDPADILYVGEVYASGGGQTLEWLDQGFLHSKSCGTGLVLTAPGGNDLWSIDNVIRPALSPDRSRAAVITVDAAGKPAGMAFVDMKTGALTPLLNDATVDRVAWSGDGQTLLFSMVAPADSIAGDAAQAVGKQMFGDIWPFPAKNYTVSLWRVSAGNAASKFFESSGRGIGAISVAPSNSGVVFSFITSSVPMIQQINNGASVDQVLQARPKIQLYYAGWASDVAPQPIGEGGQPRFGSQSTFSAGASGQANSGGAGNTNGAPTLVIGGQATVIVEGITLNVRSAPSRSAQVTRLLNPGTLVTIIGGPQEVDGLRWWQINVNDAQGGTGWVVDQITESSGTTNTLAPR